MPYFYENHSQFFASVHFESQVIWKTKHMLQHQLSRE